MNRPWFRYSNVVGWILSGLASAALCMSASMKLMQGEDMLKEWTGHLGYPANALFPIGIVELLCVVIYLIPRTAIFGAVLLAAYLGGAVASHVRVGEGFVPQVIFGVVVWVGLVLRNPSILRGALNLKEPSLPD